MAETYGELKTRCCHLRDELAAVRAERDAAVADLAREHDCQYCASLDWCVYPRDVDVSGEMCEACDKCPCGHCDGTSQWKWRGAADGREPAMSGARPGGNTAADMAKAARGAGAAGGAGPGPVRAKFCRECRYLGRLNGSEPFCDYMGITGKPRTVRDGKKVEMCPRVLEDELCRLRDQLKQIPEGLRALAELIGELEKG